MLKITYAGIDTWGRDVYKNVEHPERFYKLLDNRNLPDYPRQCLFTSKGFEGEPDTPVRPDMQIKII